MDRSSIDVQTLNTDAEGHHHRATAVSTPKRAKNVANVKSRPGGVDWVHSMGVLRISWRCRSPVSKRHEGLRPEKHGWRMMFSLEAGINRRN